MKKQTILITGANKGIGLETARQLAQKGHHVILTCRDKDRGEKAIRQLQQEGLLTVELLIMNVADENSVQQAYQQLSQKLTSLDTLINNAGIVGSLPQTPSNTTDENIKQVFETNFFGAIRTIRIFMPLLRQAPLPRIVNVTSDLASLTLHNDPSWEYYAIKGAAYGPSKTALNAYTVALAYELRDTPFKVNMINPGYTATDLNQHRGPKAIPDSTRLIVEYALLDENGPTGKFMSDYGESPW